MIQTLILASWCVLYGLDGILSRNATPCVLDVCSILGVMVFVGKLLLILLLECLGCVMYVREHYFSFQTGWKNLYTFLLTMNSLKMHHEYTLFFYFIIIYKSTHHVLVLVMDRGGEYFIVNSVFGKEIKEGRHVKCF